MMWKLGFAFGLILLLNVQQSEGQFIPIFDWVRSFFGSYEEPSYKSVRNITGDVEERIYPSKYWLCTEQFLTPATKDTKTSEMFVSLLRYVQGKNEPGQKIEMTVPVATKVDHRNGKLRSYEMCFFIPSDFQESPPKPLNPKTRLIKFPQLHVYSKLYGGYSSEPVENEQLLELSSLLKNNSISYFEENEGDRATYFYSAYDSPTKFWNRRNEIWLLASDTDKAFNKILSVSIKEEED